MAPVLVAAVAVAAGCGDESETYSVEPTSKCLAATGIRVMWNEGAGPTDPFATSGGSLIARGAYDVTVRFGKDAAEAEAVAEELERHEDPDALEGREYRFVARTRSNAVVSARVPSDQEPDESDLGNVLDAAERCLRPA